ncbi:hypothetical protein AVEN_126091-1 [Araneus ventricosus]|uniref:Uncharacterized protein n=1 Tax=Araneus ventricosus TaxID=182803 RepID=A0A4Y2CLA1_ARAVE|nr:hypothetical protein AVEN_126091-1 [Araneus ventricosus]
MAASQFVSNWYEAFIVSRNINIFGEHAALLCIATLGDGERLGTLPFPSARCGSRVRVYTVVLWMSKPANSGSRSHLLIQFHLYIGSKSLNHSNSHDQSHLIQWANWAVDHGRH